MDGRVWVSALRWPNASDYNADGPRMEDVAG